MNTHEELILLWCILSLIVAYKILAVRRMNVTSFVSVFLLGNVLRFPVAGILNLMSPEVTIDDYLWLTADLAQLACFVGFIGLYFAVIIKRDRNSIVKSTRHASQMSLVPAISSISLPSRYSNLVLVSLLPIVAAISLRLGIYYHGSIGVFEFENSGFSNGIRWLKEIGYLGIYFQFGRWVKYRYRIEFYYFAALAGMAVLLFLPSGVKSGTVGFVPILLLLYVAWVKNTVSRIATGVCLIAVVLVVIFSGQVFRGENVTGDASLSSGFSRYLQTVRESKKDPLDLEGRNSFVGRLSDFRVVGRVVDYTPDVLPFRYFDDMERWWQIAVPGFLRPIGDSINFQDGAVQVVRYGIFGGGSSPIMLFGDFYGRFGWSGLYFLSLLVGLILIRIDNSLRRQSELFRLIFFILYANLIFNLSTATLLVLFVTFTRDFVVVFVLTRAIVTLLGK